MTRKERPEDTKINDTPRIQSLVNGEVQIDHGIGNSKKFGTSLQCFRAGPRTSEAFVPVAYPMAVELGRLGRIQLGTDIDSVSLFSLLTFWGSTG